MPLLMPAAFSPTTFSARCAYMSAPFTFAHVFPSHLLPSSFEGGPTPDPGSLKMMHSPRFYIPPSRFSVPFTLQAPSLPFLPSSSRLSSSIPPANPRKPHPTHPPSIIHKLLTKAPLCPACPFLCFSLPILPFPRRKPFHATVPLYPSPRPAHPSDTSGGLWMSLVQEPVP